MDYSYLMAKRAFDCVLAEEDLGIRGPMFLNFNYVFELILAYITWLPTDQFDKPSGKFLQK